MATTVASLTSAQSFRYQLEQALTAERTPATGEPIRQRSRIRDAYAREQFRPLWTPEKAKQLLAAVEASREDGLQPDDYHHQALLLLGQRLVNEPDHVPIGLLEDAVVKSAVSAGQVLTWRDIDVPDSLALTAWRGILSRVVSPASARSDIT